MRRWIGERWRWIVPIVVVLVLGSIGAVLGGFDIGIPLAIIVTGFTFATTIAAQIDSYNRQRRLELEAHERQQLREIEDRLREKRGEVYGTFVMTFLEFLVSSKYRKMREKGTFSGDILTDRMLEFSGPLMVWGSNEVIREWSSFRRRSANRQESDSVKTIVEFESLVALMRSELGHDPATLKEGEILSMFINDLNLTGEQLRQPNNGSAGHTALIEKSGP